MNGMAEGQRLSVPVDRATLHEHGFAVGPGGQGYVSPQIGDDLPMPPDGRGWVQSPPHQGEPASRRIAFWHEGVMVFLTDGRLLREGETIMYELPLTCTWY